MVINKSDTNIQPKNGKYLNLSHFWAKSKGQSLEKRVQSFYSFVNVQKDKKEHSYQRLVISPPGREVIINDYYLNKKRKMLMFGSNNYLGLANHPDISKRVKKAIDQYGLGVGGPPLLNGYTKLMEELEERIAHFKHQESAMIFSTGYSTNLGLLSALTKKRDLILYDSLSHASFYDGLRMTKAKSIPLNHNDISDLEAKLDQMLRNTKGEIFVGIEGVYSMDGDLAPLDKIIPILKRYKAISMLDDAHGTGVLGKSGSGTAEHFGVSTEIDISMGTFSKSFAMTGGFLASSKEIINYIRYFARPYMFSASLSGPTLAAVLAGIDIIENEPWRRHQLLENTQYAAKLLEPFGLKAKPEAAIIALSVPNGMNIRKANYELHKMGIFLNAIEYPAVPLEEQRFRISLMAQHTKADIEQLVEAITKIWNDKSHPCYSNYSKNEE